MVASRRLACPAIRPAGGGGAGELGGGAGEVGLGQRGIVGGSGADVFGGIVGGLFGGDHLGSECEGDEPEDPGQTKGGEGAEWSGGAGGFGGGAE